jgi:hypothetical protein
VIGWSWSSLKFLANSTQLTDKLRALTDCFISGVNILELILQLRRDKSSAIIAEETILVRIILAIN